MSLSRSQLRNWVRLVRGMKALFDALDRQLREEAGLSHDDYILLARLSRAEGRAMRMSDLAVELSRSPSRVSHTVARLEERGWVERARGDEDRRVVVARLSDEGITMVEGVSPGHLALVESLVFETLGDAAVAQTAEALHQIGKAAGAFEGI